MTNLLHSLRGHVDVDVDVDVGVVNSNNNIHVDNNLEQVTSYIFSFRFLQSDGSSRNETIMEYPPGCSNAEDEPEQARVAVILFFVVLLSTTTVLSILALCKNTEYQYYPLILRQTLYAEGILCILVSQIVEVCYGLWSAVIAIFLMIYVIITMKLRQWLLDEQTARTSKVPSKLFRSWTVILSSAQVYIGPVLSTITLIYALVIEGVVPAEMHLVSIFIYVAAGVLAVVIGVSIDTKSSKLKQNNQNQPKEKSKHRPKNRCPCSFNFINNGNQKHSTDGQWQQQEQGGQYNDQHPKQDSQTKDSHSAETSGSIVVEGKETKETSTNDIKLS